MIEYLVSSLFGISHSYALHSIGNFITDPVKFDPCKYRIVKDRYTWSVVSECKDSCESDNSCDRCYDDLGCRVEYREFTNCIDFRCKKNKPGKSAFVSELSLPIYLVVFVKSRVLTYVTQSLLYHRKL